MQNIERIVEENPTHSLLAPSIRHSYLSDAIQYRFSASHQAGLAEFARHLGKAYPSHIPA